MFSRITVLLLAAASAQAQLTPGLIGGYSALTDVDDYLEKDLIQKELEDLMEDEECNSFQAGKQYYNNGGAYLKTIPTYGLGQGEVESAEFKEYTKWANNKDDFHLKWVRKAFDKDPLPTGYGQMTGGFEDGVVFPRDYVGSDDGECVGFEECVKKASSYVFNFIETVQLLQASIEQAKAGEIYLQDQSRDKALRFWDAAAAIYVGSLEGPLGQNFAGKSNYALANKRCRNYKVCGPERNEGASKKRTAPINTKIMGYFAAGQQAAMAGDYALMEDYKKLISAKMVVPWIQGTLRYAHRLSGERTRENLSPNTPSTDPLDNSGAIRPFSDDSKLKDPLENGFNNLGAPTEDYSSYDKEVGEAAAFALGAVPKLWACSKPAAELVWPQVSAGGGIAGFGPVNFQLVKLAFECNYKCLLTSCKEVGSLYDGRDNEDVPIDDTLSEDEQNAQKDANADIRPGAKTCNDVQFGYDPKGYATCKKVKKSIRNGKCKFLTKKPGVSKRDKPEYFATELP